MNPAARQKFFDLLTPEEWEWMRYDWEFWRRDAQMPPPGDWSIWLILAGRGFGKTWTGAKWTNWRAEQGLGPIGLIAANPADARDIMIEGPSGVVTEAHPSFRPHYEPSKRRVTWPNGVRGTIYSGEAPDQLRGPEHQTVWADEPAKWRYAQDAWDMMMMGLRIGEAPRVVATTTPRPIKMIKELIKDPLCEVTTGTTYDNLANLAPVFRKTVLRKYEGTRLGRQELLAEVLEDVPGALWSTKIIEDARRKEAAQLRRVVVAIDPAVSSTETSDETGMVVCGLGYDDEGYILEDVSGKYSPEEWGSKAVKMYHKWKADRVVAEINNGGDLVERNLRAVDVRIPYTGVRATRGKAIRAEPVAALYEQGRVHHVGNLPELEDQLTTWDATGDEKSPDRLDALVWGITALMLEETKVVGAATVSI